MSWFTVGGIRRRWGPPRDPLLPIANTVNLVTGTGSASSSESPLPTLGRHNLNDSGVLVPGHSASRPLATPAAPATLLTTTTTPTPLSSIAVSDLSPRRPLAADTTFTAAPATLWPQRFTERPTINIDFLHETQVNFIGSEWQGLEASAELVEADEEENDEGEAGDVSDSEDEELIDDFVPDPSVARVFMRKRSFLPTPSTPDIEDSWHPGAGIVERFCDFITFDYLQTPDTETEPLAFFQDRSFDGSYRSGSGAMNWNQLFTALQVPRFKDEPPNRMLSRSLNADQRRLYIRNINPQTAAALMAAASRYEASAVQDLLSVHMGHRSTIGVNIPVRGVLVFSLHLSIPYYTPTRDSHCNDDRRLSGRLLRQAINIPGIGEFREAQFSVITAGVDEGRWTTIALDDNTTRAASDLSNRLDTDSLETLFDPIVGLDVFHEDNSTARRYFLWAWMLRLEAITRSWETIVSGMEQAIVEKNEKDASWTASRLPDDMIDDLKASIDTATRWVALIEPMKMKLFMSVHNWKRFQTCDRDYFADVIASDNARSQDRSRDSGSRVVYPLIKKLYAELETYFTTLEGLISMLSSTSTQLNSLYDAAIKNRADNESREAARRHEELTRTMAAKQEELFKEMSRETARKQDEAARETARREKEMFNRKEAADRQKMEMAREAAKMQEAAFKRQAKRQEELAMEARERASKREQSEAAVTELQKKSLSTSWRVNFTSMSLLPCMLTFTLFSMQMDAMPLKPTLLGAVIALANFGILTVLLYNLDHIWRKTCDLCSRWAPHGQMVRHRALQFTWSGIMTGQTSKIGLDCKRWLGERYLQFEDRLNRPLRQRPTSESDGSFDLAAPLPAHVVDVESGTSRCPPLEDGAR